MIQLLNRLGRTLAGQLLPQPSQAGLRASFHGTIQKPFFGSLGMQDQASEKQEYNHVPLTHLHKQPPAPSSRFYMYDMASSWLFDELISVAWKWTAFS